MFLAELREIADSGLSRAARLLNAYENDWDGEIEKAYEVMSY